MKGRNFPLKRALGILLGFWLALSVSAGAECYYVVQPGDTMESIAAKYGISAEEIDKMNGWLAGRLRPGGMLKLPGGAADGACTGLFAAPNGTDAVYIAAHFGVSLSELEAMNAFPAAGRVIRGQILRIPARSCGSAPVPAESLLEGCVAAQRGDTIASLAAEFALSAEALAAGNQLSKDARIYPGQLIRVAGTAARAGYGAYIVQKGDSLIRIARRFGLSRDQLLAVNDLPRPETLVLGQILLLPRGDGGTGR